MRGSGNMPNTTPFNDKCEILADLWMTYRQEPQFEDFFQYNDVGLPIAWAITEGIVKPMTEAQTMVEETFAMLLEALSLEDDGFDTLDDVLSRGNTEQE